MTLDECRDRIAELLGWTRIAHREQGLFWERQNPIGLNTHKLYEHPVPATLDGIATLMPKQWMLTLEQDEIEGAGSGWQATAMNYSIEGPKNCKAAVGDTELEARTRLLLAVLEAERKPR